MISSEYFAKGSSSHNFDVSSLKLVSNDHIHKDPYLRLKKKLHVVSSLGKGCEVCTEGHQKNN